MLVDASFTPIFFSWAKKNESEIMALSLFYRSSSLKRSLRDLLIDDCPHGNALLAEVVSWDFEIQKLREKKTAIKNPTRSSHL